jgi:hypothetical protein
MAYRTCTKCEKPKAVREFYERTDAKGGGPQSWCKECCKEKSSESYRRRHESGEERERGWRRKGIIGVTWNDFVEMYAEQDGRCAICKNPVRLKGVGKEKTDIAHLDHNHKTGAARGLLCQNCNTGIGFLQDDLSVLIAAVEYLREK